MMPMPSTVKTTMQNRPAGAAVDEARVSPAALGWDALLAEFRALGGTAENIELRRGSRGRRVSGRFGEAGATGHRCL